MNLKAIDAAIAAYRTNLDEGDVSRLAFFRELWGVQAEAASHVDLGYEVPDADSLKTWARHGEPVLSHAPVKIEAAALADAMERLAEVLAARGGFAASTSEALSRTSWEAATRLPMWSRSSSCSRTTAWTRTRPASARWRRRWPCVRF